MIRHGIGLIHEFTGIGIDQRLTTPAHHHDRTVSSSPLDLPTGTLTIRPMKAAAQ
jgi:hypothetical protein